MNLVIADSEVACSSEQLAAVLVNLKMVCFRFRRELERLCSVGMVSPDVKAAAAAYASQIGFFESDLEALSSEVRSVTARFLDDIDEIDRFLY